VCSVENRWVRKGEKKKKGRREARIYFPDKRKGGGGKKEISRDGKANKERTSKGRGGKRTLPTTSNIGSRLDESESKPEGQGQKETLERRKKAM